MTEEVNITFETVVFIGIPIVAFIVIDHYMSLLLDNSCRPGIKKKLFVDAIIPGSKLTTIGYIFIEAYIQDWINTFTKIHIGCQN